MVSNLIKSVSELQTKLKNKNGFNFICEISTEIKSAKKIIGDVDLKIGVDQSKPTSLIFKDRPIIDT